MKGPRRRSTRMPLPGEEELEVWRRAMRDVRPLGSGSPGSPEGRQPAAEPEGPPAPEPPVGHRLRARIRPSHGHTPRPLDPAHPAGLDKRTWQRLRRGRMPIEGRIDLHGMTQAEAHRALDAFTAAMQEKGARCVLVITGRGLHGGGMLKRMTPRWLESPPLRERILTYATARVEHGGDGALYLLLRRRR